MSVLVLGGAGYIGSHTVYALIEKGEDVVIVDNLQTGFKQLIHPKAKFYQGDLRDKEFLNSVFEKEDIKGVIHFAANSLVGVSMKEPLEYYNNNVYGMICFPVGICRICFITFNDWNMFRLTISSSSR